MNVAPINLKKKDNLCYHLHIFQFSQFGYVKNFKLINVAMELELLGPHLSLIVRNAAASCPAI